MAPPMDSVAGGAQGARQSVLTYDVLSYSAAMRAPPIH